MKYLLSFAALLALLCAPLAEKADAQSGCLVCHNEAAPVVSKDGKEIDLRVDAIKLEGSVHSFLDCTGCHLGFEDNPHSSPTADVSPEIQSLADRIDSRAHVDPIALAACSNCHYQVYESVLGSVHGENAVEKGKGDGAMCLDCHGSPHSINKVASDESSPANRANVVETCGSCHGSDTITDKYGMNHNVMHSYRESFHGRKYELGHSKAPTCVNCHGYHEVLRSDNPDSPVFGGNKLETCGACHEGANKKFVAAISHEEPGPIPHYSELLLIVLTLSVFAFIVIHVLLEAYSDIRDTFFRKEKEEVEEYES